MENLISWKQQQQMKSNMSKDIRTYIASAIFVVLLILLLGYLTFIPVPDANKDLIVAIIGVLVGGASSAMSNLFGVRDEEKEKLIERIAQLEKSYAVLTAEYEILEGKYDEMRDMLVDRHIVKREGIE